MTYLNRSPDTLPVVYVQVYNNLFAPDAKRNQQTPKLGGVEFERVAVAGRVDERDREGERAGLLGGRHRHADPASPAPRFPAIPSRWTSSGASGCHPRRRPAADRTARSGTCRTGIRRWRSTTTSTDGRSTSTSARASSTWGTPTTTCRSPCPPAGWSDATGALQNPAEVLSARTRARLDSAAPPTSVVRVVTEQDKADSAATARGQQRAAHLALPREQRARLRLGHLAALPVGRHQRGHG